MGRFRKGRFFWPFISFFFFDNSYNYLKFLQLMLKFGSFKWTFDKSYLLISFSNLQKLKWIQTESLSINLILLLCYLFFNFLLNLQTLQIWNRRSAWKPKNHGEDRKMILSLIIIGSIILRKTYSFNYHLKLHFLLSLIQN